LLSISHYCDNRDYCEVIIVIQVFPLSHRPTYKLFVENVPSLQHMGGGGKDCDIIKCMHFASIAKICKLLLPAAKIRCTSVNRDNKTEKNHKSM